MIGAPSVDAAGRPGPAPNVLLFVADDVGWGDLGCYGAQKIPTPRLDELARGGVRFTDCHATSAVCSPSRYSILTGRYPWRSPLQFGVLGGADPPIIAPGVPTLASVLHGFGYRTGAFGKWHLGLGWTDRQGRRRSAFDAGPFRPDMDADGRDIDYLTPFTDGPLTHGFDRFFGIAGSLDMPPYCFLDQDRTVGIPDRDKSPLITSQRPGLQVEGWKDDQVDPTFLRTAQRWITECSDAGKPFFTYLASAAPHRPCVSPSFVHQRSGAGARGDAVCLVDWMIGELITALRSTGQWDNTIVIFTSDHGAPTRFPEDGDVTEHRPNGPWRGQKADAWEGGHRVPLIIAGPSIRRAVNQATVSLVDLLPSLVHLVAGPAPGRPALDGVVITGILDDESAGQDPDGCDGRILGQQAFDGTLALRRHSRKAIYGSGSGGFSDPVGTASPPDSADGQLYDLATDPAETINLWPTSGGEVAELHAEFHRRTGFPATAPGTGEAPA